MMFLSKRKPRVRPVWLTIDLRAFDDNYKSQVRDKAIRLSYQTLTIILSPALSLPFPLTLSVRLDYSLVQAPLGTVFRAVHVFNDCDGLDRVGGVACFQEQEAASALVRRPASKCIS